MDETNLEVEVYLHTPLLNPEHEKNYPSGSFILQGRIESRDAGGISLMIRSVGNEKGFKKLANPQWFYVPVYKIDHIVALSG